MNKRTSSAAYFGGAAILISIIAQILLRQSNFDPAFIAGPFAAGLILGAVFASFFIPPEKTKTDIFFIYLRSILGGILIGILAWPLAGACTGLTIAVIDYWNNSISLDGIFPNMLKAAMLYSTAGLTPLLGWPVIGIISFLAFLLTRTTLKENARRQIKIKIKTRPPLFRR